MENRKDYFIEKASKKILSRDEATIFIRSDNDNRPSLIYRGKVKEIAYLRGYIECCGKRICITEDNCPINICFHNKRDKEWCVFFDQQWEPVMSSSLEGFNCLVIGLVVPDKEDRYCANHLAQKISADVPVAIKGVFSEQYKVKAATITHNEQIVRMWYSEAERILIPDRKKAEVPVKQEEVLYDEKIDRTNYGYERRW